MGILNFFFNNDKDDSPDVLGKYPEQMQVHALPERRYLKTSRLLAFLIFFNLAIMIAVAGFFVYYADRIDVNVANRSGVHLYSIDSSRQVLIPSEYANKRVTALDLFAESLLRKYIINRHSVVWENSTMQSRWGTGGPVAIYSDLKNVYMPFQMSSRSLFSESRAKGFVRDVHLYELKKIKPTLWEAVFDTFDMPIPDVYTPICNCSDNSKQCIDCKVEHTSRRLRFRVFIRARFIKHEEASQSYKLANPLGFTIKSYNMLYVPIKEKENFWQIPTELKPDL